MSHGPHAFRKTEFMRALKVADDLGKTVKRAEFKPGGGFALEFGEEAGEADVQNDTPEKISELIKNAS